MYESSATSPAERLNAKNRFSRFRSAFLSSAEAVGDLFGPLSTPALLSSTFGPWTDTIPKFVAALLEVALERPDETDLKQAGGPKRPVDYGRTALFLALEKGTTRCS